MADESLTIEEQMVALAKRTNLDVSLLRHLPEEKISDYFNQTVKCGSRPPGYYFDSLSNVCIGLGIAYAFSGRAGMAVFSFILSVASIVGQTIKETSPNNEITINKNVAKEIQKDISAGLTSVHL